jgi:hypothetical protein
MPTPDATTTTIELGPTGSLVVTTTEHHLAAPVRWMGRHCQSAHPDKDTCFAGRHDGVVCADGECDIDNGVRSAPAAAPSHLSFCSSLDDTMRGYPNCDCGEVPPAAAAALKALDEVIPPHLRSSRHGENFMGERYATIRAALTGGKA